MSQNPIVSVIIPAYNIAPYIGEALGSLFDQSFRDFEAIVVNDGSTDETEDKIEPYRDRIVYIKQVNRGLAVTRNVALQSARGRYMALLDGDDIWLPETLETLVRLLNADRTASVVYPNAFFYGSPNFGGKLYQDVFPASQPVTFERVLKRECCIFSSLLFRREVIDDVGTYDENLDGQGSEDFDLALRMLQAGHRFIFTTEPLVKYRWRQESLSNNGIGLYRCAISVYEKFYADEKTTPEQRQWIKSYLCDLRAELNLARFKELMRTGEYEEAGTQLALANEHYRSLKLELIRGALQIMPQLVKQWVTR
jgi:glycosyltransferase involved in cell wall biosynthesis